MVTAGAGRLAGDQESARIAPAPTHWLLVTLAVLYSIGSSYDARYHIHHGLQIESFLTPPHYLLFGSVLGIGVVLAALGLRSVSGRPIGLPAGYATTALGVVLFGVAGLLDLAWHTTFGFEINLESVFSPAHHALVISAGLIMLGLLRQALHARRLRPERYVSFGGNLALLIPLAALLRVMMWFTWYVDPLAVDYAAGGALVGRFPVVEGIDFGSTAATTAGTYGFVLTMAILVAFILVALSRLRCPVGSVTFIIVYYSLLRAWGPETYAYLPAGIAAGVAADLVWAWMRRGGEVRLAASIGYRVIAVVTPLVYAVVYFALVAGGPAGLVWPVHLWAGVISFSALAGFALSLAVVGAPQQPRSPAF